MPISEPIILVAEDDRLTREMLAESLREAQMRPVLFESGEEALGSLDAFKPDLVLLDLEMPGISGIDTCVGFRDKFQREELPIIIATGHGDTSTISAAYSAGATDFLIKPIVFPILIERIRYLLQATASFEEAAEARSSLEEAQRLMKSGSWRWNEAEDLVWISDGLRQLFKMPLNVTKRCTQQDLLAFSHPDDRALLNKEFARSLRYGKEIVFEHRIETSSGELSHVKHQVAPILGSTGDSLGLKGVILDRTDEALAKIRAEKLENFDPDTGFPNRRSLVQILNRSFRLADSGGKHVAILCFELDRANSLQTTLDDRDFRRVIQTVGARLDEEIRRDDSVGLSSAPWRVSVSHSREHQFSVVLTNLNDEWSAFQIGQRLRSRLAEPYTLSQNGETASSRASAGMSTYPRDGARPEELLRSAERALQHSKNLGGDRIEAASPELTRKIESQLRIERDLARAVEQDGIDVDYQPRLSLSTGCVVGLEALARWGRGVDSIGPSEFIPIAENSGIIEIIGDLVLGKACNQVRTWISEGRPDLRVSVNVSPHQLRGNQFVERVEKTVHSFEIPPSQIEMEITEGVFFEPDRAVQDTLHQLRDFGVSLAVDDFGTGYASLPYLLRLPFDTLKLDRIFVTPLATETAAQKIATGVIALAHSLGMRVVAEGVETQAQLRVLEEFKCDEAQGFLFSRPLPPDEIESFLDSSTENAPLPSVQRQILDE